LIDEPFERELTDEELEQVIGGVAISGINVANIAGSQILQGNTVQVPVNVAPTTFVPVTAPVTIS